MLASVMLPSRLIVNEMVVVMSPVICGRNQWVPISRFMFVRYTVYGKSPPSTPATPDVPGATTGAAGAVDVAAGAGAGGGGGTRPGFFVDFPNGDGGAVFLAGVTGFEGFGVSTTGTGS